MWIVRFEKLLCDLHFHCHQTNFFYCSLCKTLDWIGIPNKLMATSSRASKNVFAISLLMVNLATEIYVNHDMRYASQIFAAASNFTPTVRIRMPIENEMRSNQFTRIAIRVRGGTCRDEGNVHRLQRFMHIFRISDCHLWWFIELFDSEFLTRVAVLASKKIEGMKSDNWADETRYWVTLIWFVEWWKCLQDKPFSPFSNDFWHSDMFIFTKIDEKISQNLSIIFRL